MTSSSLDRTQTAHTRKLILFLLFFSVVLSFSLTHSKSTILPCEQIAAKNVDDPHNTHTHTQVFLNFLLIWYDELCIYVETLYFVRFLYVHFGFAVCALVENPCNIYLCSCILLHFDCLLWCVLFSAVVLSFSQLIFTILRQISFTTVFY